MKAREWFRFHNTATDPSVVDIHVVDIIGDWIDELINQYWGVTATLTAKAFIDQLAQLPDAVKAIRVHINSPGGDVFAASNIANALRDQQMTKGRTVDTFVDGIAASAATIIMMAGKTVNVADNGVVMVHNPMTVAAGNAADLRQTADTLDTVRNTIIAAYKWHSTLDDAVIAALMDAETWMDADAAVANGFATNKIEGLKAAATLDSNVLASLKVPESFKARVSAFAKPAPTPAPAPVVADASEILAAVDAAGLGTAFARELITAKLPMADVTARITTEGAKRQASADRANQIRALCTTAKLPKLADGYINGAMAVKDVQQHLTDITAAMDQAVIDTGLPPEGEVRNKKTIDSTAIYADLNTPKSK